LQAARRGEWRVVGLMLDRVFGRPTERIETEAAVPEHVRVLQAMSPEEQRAMWRWLRGGQDADAPASF
jgi:hypothetical protein